MWPVVPTPSEQGTFRLSPSSLPTYVIVILIMFAALQLALLYQALPRVR